MGILKKGKTRVSYKKKIGLYWGRCRHTSKHWRHPERVQMAWVHFDGNKNWSKVPFIDLAMDNIHRCKHCKEFFVESEMLQWLGHHAEGDGHWVCKKCFDTKVVK